MDCRPRFSVSRLELFADRLRRDVEDGRIAGASVLVGDRIGEVWRTDVGYRDIASGDRLRADAVWRIFSMTKVMVSVAALVLIERGVLRLDQAVADFIPAFGRMRILEADGRTVPAIALPTVQDLLRHTAGLGYGYLGEGAVQRAYQADGFLAEDLDNAAFVERIAALPLEYQPGTVWHYSHATDVLGRVSEVITGTDLQAALDDLLLLPLGLRDTRFTLPKHDALRVAEPLPQAPGQRPIFADPTVKRRGQRGNGGLVCTIDDYARFLRMLLDEGRHDGCALLAPATVRLMTSDHLGAGIAHAPYYPPGPGYGFGLGVAVRIAAGEAPFPGTRGDWFWSGVGGTYFWVDPASGFFAILMMQTSSAQQRQHYRSVSRSMIYAALDS